MTTEQYIVKQRKNLSELEKGLPLLIASRTAMAAQAHRIFIDGKNSAGGNIGHYDTTTPLYVNPNYAPRATANKIKGIQGLLPTRGNPSASLIEDPEGEHTFIAATAHRGIKGTKAGDIHRTTWLKNYKEFRNRIGRRIDKVDLTLTGDFQSDFRNAPIGSLKVNPKKISQVEYHTSLSRAFNIKKAERYTDKYGTIFKLTKEERELFIKTFHFEVKNRLSQ